MNVTEHRSPEHRANQVRFEDPVDRCRADPGLRARIDSGDTADTGKRAPASMHRRGRQPRTQSSWRSAETA